MMKGQSNSMIEQNDSIEIGVDNIEDRKRCLSGNIHTRTRFLNRNAVPGTFSSHAESIPHAYPVPVSPNWSSNLENDSIDRNENNIVDNTQPSLIHRKDQKRRRGLFRSVGKIWILLVVFIMISTGSYLIKLLLGFEVDTINNHNITSHEKDFNSTQQTNDNMSSTSDDLQDESEQKEESNYTCYTDPILIQQEEFALLQLIEDGNASVVDTPRTYIICPNTNLQVFNFSPISNDFDFSSGEVFPFIIFLSNVNILCGLDGSIHNNCTLSGGFFQILFFFRTVYRSYQISSKAENITIQGMKFTGASKGSNVGIRIAHSSITFRDCMFYNNNEMMSIIYTTWGKNITKTRVNIENCVFENNTLSHNDRTTTAWRENIKLSETEMVVYPPHIGVILANPRNNSMDIQVGIQNSVFQNNTFLNMMDMEIMFEHYNNDNYYHSSVLLLDHEHNGKNFMFSAAVINLLPPVKLLDMRQTCFIENQGYVTGVIAVGAESMLHISGIHVSNNEPYDYTTFNKDEGSMEAPQSCTLMLYRNDTMIDEMDHLHLNSGCHDELIEQENVCNSV